MSEHILQTPAWVFGVRIAQVLLSLIILGLSASIAHDVYLDELGLGIAVPILTWIVVAYALATEKVVGWQAAYHVLAVIVLDGFMLIIWLATWAAVAARRAAFRIPTAVGNCSDNGDVVNSKYCDLLRRDLLRRDIPVLFKKGLAEMAAIAGLGALVWLLFIATFAWTMVAFLRGRKDGRFPIGAPSSGSAEPKVESQPMVAQQQPVVAQQPVQPQPQPYQQYPPTQSPYQQQPPYAPPQTQSPPPEQYAQTYPQAYPPQQPQQPHPQQYQQPELQGQNYVPPAVSPPPQQYHQQ